MASTTDVAVAFFAAHGNGAIARGEPAPEHLMMSNVEIEWSAGTPARFFVFDLSRNPKLADTIGLVLVARREKNDDDVYKVDIQYSPLTTLTEADVIAFVESCADKERVKASYLERKPSVDQVASILAPTSISDATRAAWRDLYDSHRNPHRTMRFVFQHVAAHDALPVFTDRDAARARLAKALDEMIAYAKSEKLEPWLGTFEVGRAALDGTAYAELVARDFAHSGLDTKALQLLDAAWKADVFGGMGSFNDVVGSSSASNAVFAALRPAIEAAINA
jgi:hypothetical protein